MPEPNVYEIRFVGDAESITAAAEKAKAAVEGLGQTTAQESARMAEAGKQLALQFGERQLALPVAGYKNVAGAVREAGQSFQEFASQQGKAEKGTALYEGTTRGLMRSIRLAAYQLSGELNPALATTVFTLDRAALSAQLTGGRLGALAAGATVVGTGLAMLLKHMNELKKEADELAEVLRGVDPAVFAAKAAAIAKELRQMTRDFPPMTEEQRRVKEEWDEWRGVGPEPGPESSRRFKQLQSDLEKITGPASTFAEALREADAHLKFYAVDAGTAAKGSLDWYESTKTLTGALIGEQNALKGVQRQILELQAAQIMAKTEFMSPYNLEAIRKSVELRGQALDLQLRQNEAERKSPAIQLLPPDQRRAALDRLAAQDRMVKLQKDGLILDIQRAEALRSEAELRTAITREMETDLALAEAFRNANDEIAQKVAAIRDEWKELGAPPEHFFDPEFWKTRTVEGVRAAVAYAREEWKKEIAKNPEMYIALGIEDSKKIAAEGAEAYGVAWAARIRSMREEFNRAGEIISYEMAQGMAKAEARGERISLIERQLRSGTLSLGEAFDKALEVGFFRLREAAGTYGENIVTMMEGIGSAMSRGLEDTFFSVVTGQFKGLVDVARQVGYAIVREMTRVTAQMAVRGLFGGQGGTGGLFGSLLSMLGLIGGGGGVARAVPEILRGQHGGIFTKPTLTMIAEAGEAEAVIPLSKLGKQGGGGVTVINLSDRDQLAAIVAQEMSKGREVIVNDVVQGLRGNSALRRGVRRFT